MTAPAPRKEGHTHRVTLDDATLIYQKGSQVNLTGYCTGPCPQARLEAEVRALREALDEVVGKTEAMIGELICDHTYEYPCSCFKGLEKARALLAAGRGAKE